MKKITFIICLLFSGILVAQNRISYSQYMHNLGLFNPAYFTEDNQVVVNSFLRNQWAGIKGAPTTKSLVAGVDLKNKHTINFNIHQDDITIYSDIKIGLGYNYRINLSESTLLSFGIKGDFGFIGTDYSSLTPQEANDFLLSNNFESQKYMNMGFGLFLQSTNYFVGFSMPYLFKKLVDNSTNVLLNDGIQLNHTYLTMGNKFEFKNFTFTPTALFKAISGSPLELDVNANFLLKDQLWLSGGYRSNNEIILAVGYVLFKNLKFGYSYDFPFFSSTNSFSGSHEVSLGYGISFYKKYSNKKRSILKRNKNFKRRVKF